VAAVAVSFIHGCALQAVIDPKEFFVRHHFDAAARMLDNLGMDEQPASRRSQQRRSRSGVGR
jgi:hypothetical protein